LNNNITTSKSLKPHNGITGDSFFSLSVDRWYKRRPTSTLPKNEGAALPIILSQLFITLKTIPGQIRGIVSTFKPFKEEAP
jgi:hypothetical protein